MNTSTGPRPAPYSGLKIVALILAALYLAVCGVLFAVQEQIVFRPTVGGGKDPASQGLAFTPVTLATADGEALNAWYVPPPATADTPRHILFLHGNAGNLSHRLATLRVLHELGHGVLALDYRGYGLSSGTPSEAGTYLDARAAWRYLTETLAIPASDIVLYGRSLGGAVAAALAGQVQARGLIIESAFTRLADMARHRYPYLPVQWLLLMEYDSAARLRTISCPVLVAHSPDDRVVPFAMGEALAAAARNLTDFVVLKGSHNRAFLAAGPDYHRRLDQFIRGADLNR